MLHWFSFLLFFCPEQLVIAVCFKHKISKCLSSPHPFPAKCSYVPAIILTVFLTEDDFLFDGKKLKVKALSTFQTTWCLKIWFPTRLQYAEAKYSWHCFLKQWKVAGRGHFLFYICIMRWGPFRGTGNISLVITVVSFTEQMIEPNIGDSYSALFLFPALKCLSFRPSRRIHYKFKCHLALFL